MSNLERLERALRSADAAARAGDAQAAQDAKLLANALRDAMRKPADSAREAMLRRRDAARSGTLQLSPHRQSEQAAIDQRAEDQMVIDSNGGVLGGIAVKGSQGLPFVGSYVDEAMDLVNPGSGRRITRIQEAMDREYPKTAGAAEITGTVAGTIPMALAAGPSLAAAAPKSRSMQVLSGGLLGMLGGGTEGAVYGFGVAEGEGRFANAATHGATGAAFGGAAGAMAPFAFGIIGDLIQRYKGSDVKAIAQEFGVSSDTAKVLKTAFQNNDTGAVDRILRAGSEATMADAGRSGAALLDAAAQQGGRPLNIVDNAVTARANRSLPQVNSALDEALGPVRGPRQTAREVAETSRPQRQAAYGQAYNTPIDYASPQGREIETLLRRIDPSDLNNAVKIANKRLRWEGGQRQILADIAEDGHVSFREMPSVRQLDELKKALNQIDQNNRDLFGRSMDGGLSSQQASAVRDATVKATGGDQGPYAAALRIGGDKIEQDRALEFGLRMLRDTNKTTKEMAAETLQGMSADGRKMVKAGVRAYIDDVVGRVKSIASDTDADEARQAMRAIKELSSPNAQAKLKLLLGARDFNRLMPQIDEALMSQGMRASVVQNSKTAVRGNIGGAVDEVTAPGVYGRATRGEPIEGTKALVQFLLNTTPGADAARKEEIWSEIATVLSQKRGNRSAEAALKYVENAISGQPLSESQAKLVASQVTTGGVLMSGPSARQSLSMPQ